MFELFGSDSDKKEEIDKNMDKIKDMVGSSSNTDRPSETQSPGQARRQGPTESQRAPRQTSEQDNTSSPGPVQAEGRQPPQGPRSPKSDSSGTQDLSPGPKQVQNRSTAPQEHDRDSVTAQRPESSPDSSTDQQGQNGPSQDRDSPAPLKPQNASGQQNTAPSQQAESKDEGLRKDSTPDEKPEPEPDKDESEPEPPKRQEIPEAPQTREIEVPDIEKGPLFIRVKKFKEAKKMIHEMQNLADDVETDMGGLQNTLEEDKDVQKDLKGRLKKLRDSMKSIHTIVSP